MRFFCFRGRCASRVTGAHQAFNSAWCRRDLGRKQSPRETLLMGSGDRYLGGLNKGKLSHGLLRDALVTTMEKIARECIACGRWEHPDDPLCEDRFDDEELIHRR